MTSREVASNCNLDAGRHDRDRRAPRRDRAHGRAVGVAKRPRPLRRDHAHLQSRARHEPVDRRLRGEGDPDQHPDRRAEHDRIDRLEPVGLAAPAGRAAPRTRDEQHAERDHHAREDRDRDREEDPGDVVVGVLRAGHAARGRRVATARRRPRSQPCYPDCADRQPQRTAHGSPRSVAAHSSSSACANACGRLPRSWRWVTSNSSESRPGRSARGAVALEPARRLQRSPLLLERERHPEAAQHERALGLAERRARRDGSGSSSRRR